MKCASRGCERDAAEGRFYCEHHQATGIASHGRKPRLRGPSKTDGKDDLVRENNSPKRDGGNALDKSPERGSPSKK